MSTPPPVKPLAFMEDAWAEHDRKQAESDRKQTESDRKQAESDRLWNESYDVVTLTALALHGEGVTIDWTQHTVTLPGKDKSREEKP